ncbi:hypothetical protein BGZ51_008870 [Haplosporangium sp. Z 767]|nr:hypothetical protein BGZ51_008870 [Haplosporangium sp. Z 767]
MESTTLTAAAAYVSATPHTRSTPSHLQCKAFDKIIDLSSFTNNYIKTHAPKDWLPECFFGEMSGSMKEYLDMLNAVSKRKTLPKVIHDYVQNLYNYYNKEPGIFVLELLYMNSVFLSKKSSHQQTAAMLVLTENTNQLEEKRRNVAASQDDISISATESSSSAVALNVCPSEKEKEDPLSRDMDGSTFDGHGDFESAAVNNDGGLDPAQEAEEAEGDNDDDNDEVSEIILFHDFHGLFEALYCAANNMSLRIPEMPKMESTLKTSLFQYVRDRLTIYRDLPRVLQKDLFVAVSSIAHLHCTEAKTILKLHDMPKLLKMVKEPEMAIPSTTLLDLLMTMKDQAQDDQGIFDANQLVGLIDIEKGSLETKRRQGQKIDVTIKLAIDILQIVAPLCVADPIHRPMDTEQKSQAVWERVFNTLFEKTIVTTVIGETGLEGSGEARTQNEAEYAVQQLKGETKSKKKEPPRKVDCKFVVSVERMKKWEFVTILNSEMKALRSSSDEIEVMTRKNIRHNHLIINRIGAPKIYFLNMHAYSATLMSLHEHDGVHVCGNVLDHDLAIPTNALELECFMNGQTLTALLSLRSFFLQIGRELALQKLKSRSGSTTPISAYSNIRTFYTPKKDRSMSSPKKQPPPSPKKRRSAERHPMDNSFSSSSAQMDPQTMKESRKRRG